MQTKAQVYKSCRAKVKKAYAKFQRLEAALEKARLALREAHNQHQKKTGLSFGQKETMQAFHKRVGPAEVLRYQTLANCHALAKVLMKKDMAMSLSTAQMLAWKQVGCKGNGLLPTNAAKARRLKALEVKALADGVTPDEQKEAQLLKKALKS